MASPGLISRVRETSTSQTKTSRSTERRSGDRMWVTVPFHPVWAKHIAKAIRKFLNDDNWNAILSQGFEGHQNFIDKIRNAQIAWYNYLQPHVFEVQMLSIRGNTKTEHARSQFVDSSLHNLLILPCTLAFLSVFSSLCSGRADEKLSSCLVLFGVSIPVQRTSL